MDIEIFTLCDAATDYQGRLCILGVFDTIFASNLPAIHAQCAVALRMRFQKIEEGTHTLTLHIVNEDGVMVIPALNGQFVVQMPGTEREGTINVVLNLQGLNFTAYGQYEVNLAIDNINPKSIPFWIKQPT